MQTGHSHKEILKIFSECTRNHQKQKLMIAFYFIINLTIEI
jgi:hypothetical protein